MIDWINLAANALWIIGCSVILAAFSYASWMSSEKKWKLTRSLRSSGVWRVLHYGAVLICAGLAATSDSLFQALLWIILAIAIVVNLFWNQPT